MSFFFTIAADLVIIVHFLWIAFLILGFPLFLYLNRPGWRLFHLTSLIVTVIMQLTRTICPLTYLENYLTSVGGNKKTYPGQFIIETIERLIYVEDMTLEKISYATILFLILVALSFYFRPIPLRKRQRVQDH